MAQKVRKKLVRIFAVALVSTVWFSLPIATSAETDAERIEALEKKLQRTLELVESLQHAINNMKEALASEAEETTAVSEEVEERLDEVEELAYDLDERVGSRAVVNAFDAVELDLGGYLHLVGSYVHGEDNSLASFNRQVFDVLFSATIADNWDLFVSQAFIRNADPDFSDPRNPDFAELDKVKPDTVIAWANYRHHQLLNIRAGRFTTGHGIINREHFPALLYDPSHPQALRPTNEQIIFPHFTNGVMLHGGRFLGEESEDYLAYSTYIGNFEGNASHFNLGGRLAYEMGRWGLTLGANLAAGSRVDGFDSDYYLYGVDLLYDEGPLLWKNELFLTDEDRGGDRLGFYTMPIWRFNSNWAVFYRFDYFDAASNPATLVQVGESTENALGISFKPTSNIHLRNIWTYRSIDATNTLPSANAWLWQLSATVSF